MYYRECKKLNGNTAYEFHEICNCHHCKMRNIINPGTKNQVTVTTEDPGKFKEIRTFLTNWACGSSQREAVAYYEF